jgi:hypothetical protein
MNVFNVVERNSMRLVPASAIVTDKCVVTRGTAICGCFSNLFVRAMYGQNAGAKERGHADWSWPNSRLQLS